MLQSVKLVGEFDWFFAVFGVGSYLLSLEGYNHVPDRRLKLRCRFDCSTCLR